MQSWCVLAAALLILIAAPAVAANQPAAVGTPALAADPLASSVAAIARSQDEVAAVARGVANVDGPLTTARLIDRAQAAAQTAQAAVAELAAGLASAPTPARRAAWVGAIARGGGVITRASRLTAVLRDSAAARVERTITKRAPSPLSPAFWWTAAATWPAAAARLGRFMADQADVTWRGLASAAAWAAALGLAVALALLLPVRRWLLRAARRALIGSATHSRLRRSGWAVARALIGTLLPWLAMTALYEGFAGGGMVSAPWHGFALGVIRAVAVAAGVTAVAGALLQRSEPSWRLLPVSDEAAAAIRPWTMAAAAAVGLTVVIDELMIAAAIAPAVRDAAAVLETLAQGLVIAVLLVVVEQVRRRADAVVDRAEAMADARMEPRTAGERRAVIAAAVVILFGWMTLAAAAVALAIGYDALALLIVRLMVWLPLVAATLYLGWVFADDLTTSVLSGESAVGRALHRAFGVRISVIDQAGIALSAVLQIILLLLAAVAAFAPFGSNLGQLVGLAHAFENGVTIGQVVIAPGSILRALAVLAVGIMLVRVAESWLIGRYLPKTELDVGARNSVSTIVRYTGFLLAVAWALAALGIGFQRVALVLSALSVGIGFGLQAITQNFVSGLILLIERPVKIGDLVEVDGQRGDVKRISVRATEIETGDRATLIVPNSELITKTVRNLTHADPMGVVEVNFTVPLDADVDAVRSLLLDLFRKAEAVFNTPQPKAFIDSIDGGVVHFSGQAFCASPRAAYATRSDVFFELIMALRDRGIAIGSASAGKSSSIARGD